MKVLFITIDTPDYLEVMIYHGFFCFKNATIYSNANFWYLFNSANSEDLKKLYGHGFGYTKLLHGNQNILSQIEIIRLIRERYFDLIIYSQPHKTLKHLRLVKSSYPNDRIVYLDGEDDNYDPISAKEMLKLISSSIFHLKIHPKILMLLNIHLKFSKLGRSYFKREINFNPYNFSLISFSIPQENIINEVPKVKTKTVSNLIPGIKETYIYFDQTSYFAEYRSSKYAYTFKKGGWDCFRHYEILANGCIPIFPDLISCPQLTMFSFPKELILEINTELSKSDLSKSKYDFYSNLLLEYTKENLTTAHMVRFLLNQIGYNYD